MGNCGANPEANRQVESPNRGPYCPFHSFPSPPDPRQQPYIEEQKAAPVATRPNPVGQTGAIEARVEESTIGSELSRGFVGKSNTRHESRTSFICPVCREMLPQSAIEVNCSHTPA